MKRQDEDIPTRDGETLEVGGWPRLETFQHETMRISLGIGIGRAQDTKRAYVVGRWTGFKTVHYNTKRNSRGGRMLRTQYIPP